MTQLTWAKLGSTFAQLITVHLEPGQKKSSIYYYIVVTPAPIEAANGRSFAWVFVDRFKLEGTRWVHCYTHIGLLLKHSKGFDENALC